MEERKVLGKKCGNMNGFPFEPYGIQRRFMEDIERVLDDKLFGVFESPTGTGKSLSIICGVLSWFESKGDFPEPFEECVMTSSWKDDDCNLSNENKSKKELPFWIKKQYDDRIENEKKRRREERLKKVSRMRQRIRDLIHGTSSSDHNFDFIRGKSNNNNNNNNVNSNYNYNKFDGNIVNGDVVVNKENATDDFQVHSLDEFLLEDDLGNGLVGHEDDSEDEEDEEDVLEGLKIFYSSRTHSQLSQFANEVKRTEYAGRVRSVSLGGRQLTCINESVRKLHNHSLINDKCLELQQDANKGGRSQKGCPFRKGAKKMSKLLLTEVMDIEECASLGRRNRICPYYSSRFALPFSSLVMLPYNCIMHDSTRKALGIKLAGNVVIVDEAHNLPDAIASMHSVDLTSEIISKSRFQLREYERRFEGRLNPLNLVRVRQILFLLDSFSSFLETLMKTVDVNKGQRDESVKVMTITDFQFSINADNLNLFELKDYFFKSQIALKVQGYVEHREAEETQEVKLPQSHIPPLSIVRDFLACLTNDDGDGRIVAHFRPNSSPPSTHGTSGLKFILLNPEKKFSQVVKEAGAVILVGGTLQPFEHLITPLLPREFLSTGGKVVSFSYNHVAPPEDLLVLPVRESPSGTRLDFTHSMRSRVDILDGLWNSLANIAAIVPGGLISFFPSYKFEEEAHAYLSKASTIYRKIVQHKRLFRERRDQERSESELKEFTKVVTEGGGGFLSCIVGGKLSEGINFSDDLARGVVIIGMPYPNPSDPVLIEKLKFFKGLNNRPQGDWEFYQSICYRAINQSIGRAIRHLGDYAAIILLDSRYEIGVLKHKLPQWMVQSLRPTSHFRQAEELLSDFFQHRQQDT